MVVAGLELLTFRAEIEEPINRETVKVAFTAAGRTMPDKFGHRFSPRCAQPQRASGAGCAGPACCHGNPANIRAW
ncbi:hypothetical protein [Amycolatopsis speibonae]|uniref:Uncharacterized protein n=1 Tax=Amycolatopsis speibonae TaxID=1450224 RepID=A0ABV7NNC9_9PSEU